MIRPTGAVAISRRHFSRERSTRTDSMGPTMRNAEGDAGGAKVPLLVAEDPRREGGGLGAALHAQLVEQRGHVVLHGLLGEEEVLADLPVGQALADELQDLLLLGGEAR